MITTSPHPFAEIFPLLEGPAFSALVADIREHGQRDSIVLFDGRILDGRNRLRACIEAGVEPQTTTFVGTEAEALELVLSTNLHRRHLDESQRAMVAARIAALRTEPAEETRHAPIGAARETAAKAMNVGARTVTRAAKVLSQGAPELVRAVDSGEVTVAAAAEVAELPVERQREVVASGKDAVRSEAKEHRERKSDRPKAEDLVRVAARAVAAVPIHRMAELAEAMPEQAAKMLRACINQRF